MGQTEKDRYDRPGEIHRDRLKSAVVRHILVISLVASLSFVAVGCGESDPVGPPVFAAYPPMEIVHDKPYSVIFTTDVGRMTFTLLPKEALLAVNSFVFLAKNGFYDGLTFHRLVPELLVETGDPTGTGDGGPGYTFEIEPPQRPYERGVLAMANSGAPNSNGSRFFIILGDVTTTNDLPGEYTVFGHIKEGHSPSARTLDKLASIAVGPGPTGEVSVPQEQVKILTAKATEGCRATVIMWTQGC